MLRIVAGTYDGTLYGLEAAAPAKRDETSSNPFIKLVFGYSSHTGCIKSLALTEARNGRILLSGSSDETIKIYDVEKRIEIGTLMEQKGCITCLATFRDTHVLSASTDKTICIWRTSDWSCLHILGGHKDEVNGIAIHPSGKLCLSVSKDRTLRMWNLVKGRCAFISSLDTVADMIKLSTAGDYYALVFGTVIKIFSFETATVTAELTHPKKILCCEFVDGQHVVCAGEDTILYIWDIEGNLLARVSNSEWTARIRCLDSITNTCESHPSKLLALATSNGIVQVWGLDHLLSLPKSSKVQESKPIRSTVLLNSPRITSISASFFPILSIKPVEKADPYPQNSAKSSPKTPLPLAQKPSIVIELCKEAPRKGRKRRKRVKNSIAGQETMTAIG